MDKSSAVNYLIGKLLIKRGVQEEQVVSLAHN
jgi:hypothetical protein